MTGDSTRQEIAFGGASKLLVSACLLGDPLRHDGKAKLQAHDGLQDLLKTGRLVAFCPEVAGGLPVPRADAEIVGSDGDDVMNGEATVQTNLGEDVSAYFLAREKQALSMCREQRIEVALLTERSPSCGSDEIYDGSFLRQTQASGGVTTACLRHQGIRVFSHLQIDAALEYLVHLDQKRL